MRTAHHLARCLTCRRATAEVLALLHRLAPAAVIEKASIDEARLREEGQGMYVACWLPPQLGCPCLLCSQPMLPSVAAARQVYMDVTSLVDQEVQARKEAAGAAHRSTGAAASVPARLHPCPAANVHARAPPLTPGIDRSRCLLLRCSNAPVQGRAAAPVDAFAWGSIVIGGPLDVGSEFERRLAVGAGIACRLRGALQSELGESESSLQHAV